MAESMNRGGFTPDEIETLGLRDGECGCCWIVDAIGLEEFIAKRVAAERAVTYGIDWARRYYGICPKCNEDKFIGHGPLCIDCHLTPTDHP